MKKLFVLMFMMMLALGIRAQTTADDIGLIQSVWGMEKRAIVSEYMALTEAEATVFWKEYDAYEAARKELGKERIMLIDDYVKNFGSITPEKATELVTKTSANNQALEKLLLKTFKNLSKVMSPVRAAQFVQMEKYFSNVLQLTIKDNLPFIGELEELRNK